MLIRFTVLLCLVVSAVARAQAPAWPAAVSVRVVDTANVPVADADVSVVRNVSTILSHAATNARGVARISFARTPGALQVAVRKIGYQPGYRFFTLSDADSTAVDVVLARAVSSLETVKVTAQEDVLRKSYHLDAEDIANSPRVMLEGTDIFKLRPDMLNSRGGARACAIPYTQHDGWVENVWINGRHITLPILSETTSETERGLGLVPEQPRPDPLHGGRTKSPARTVSAHVDTVVSILQSVKPEHIAEVTYHDCFAAPMERNFTDMAVFITLKPGVAYRDGVGSYVLNEDSLKAVAAASPNEGTAAPSARAAAIDAELASPAALPPYRFRLLGVYDEESGQPIPGVEVSDVFTGARSLTSKTGTVSLFFLPDGGSLIRLRLLGYGMQTLTVPISPRDTAPITVVLSHVTALPAVVVNEAASSTGYLSSNMKAFEERRKAGFGYFVDEATMRKNDNRTLGDALVSHFPGLMIVSTGKGGQTLVSTRKMCTGSALSGCKTANCVPKVYVDGVQANLGGAGNAIDFSHLSPNEYAAAEFYADAAMLPAGFSPTNAECGVILLWSRER